MPSISPLSCVSCLRSESSHCVNRKQVADGVIKEVWECKRCLTSWEVAYTPDKKEKID